MPALRPLFAAAGVLLLVAVVLLGVRATDDGSVPSADGPESPSPTVAQPTDDATGTSEPIELPTSPAPTEDGTDEPSTDGTEHAGTGGTSTGGTSTDGTGDGTTDGTSTDDGTTDGTSTDEGATGGSDEGATGGSDDGEDDGQTVVAIGETDDIDDMPDTGGGVASLLGGLLAVGAAAGLGRRR